MIEGGGYCEGWCTGIENPLQWPTGNAFYSGSVGPPVGPLFRPGY
jgi:hypothetical protein